MRYITKKVLPLCVVAFLNILLTAQSAEKNFSWDFSNCAVRDIIYAVSLDTGITIVADATVNGSGDFRFVGGDFETAFDAFLSSSRLYAEKRDGVWTVSRAKIFIDDAGKIFADACDVLPSLFVEKISAATKTVITYTSLPSVPVTSHLQANSVGELLRSLARQFSGYELTEHEGTFHFQQSSRPQSQLQLSDTVNTIVKESDGTFSCDIKNAAFNSVAEKLFSLAGKHYCVLAGGNTIVPRAVFSGYSFEKTLSILCAQAALDVVVSESVYCIIQGNKNRNEIVNAGKEWKTFSLNYTNTNEFIPFLAKRISGLETLPFPDKTKFLCAVTEPEEKSINELIVDFDKPRNTYLVKLKYAKTEEILAHLPPSVDASSLRDAGDGTSIFFTGTQESYDELLAQLALCDRPVKRISYDILIMQYEDTEDSLWSSKLGVRRMQLGDRNGTAVQLGNVLSFNLDVVGAFGLAFAADMQAAISENAAHVFADTTVHGVSGRQINFQNTNTHRYRDNNVDPETGKPLYTGITREITSGLKIDILGWVSGDGMITSKVTASISRQGTDLSSVTGNPPPTTEKIITTEVRGRNCEPLILSGLIQNSDSTVTTRTPLLSKIPILGWLFKDRNKTKTKTEMIIYLVPHIETDEDDIAKNNFSVSVSDETVTEEFAVNAINRIDALFRKER